jgi:hypothetical protein
MEEIHNVYPDARLITDAERQKLSEMMYRAFLEIRILEWKGKTSG